MYKAIYRTFRPGHFEEIIGQEHIVKILKNQLARGQTGHAYLFCGTRGTGKTTTARILAKALNCTGEGEHPCCKCESCKSIKEGNFIDVIEIDAASNNSVDDIRNLCESVNYPPIMGKCKIYIIDEVHMLSGSAFNALLKTLEEPPKHVVFILATTEVQKLPATILSRCIRLDFRRISEKKIIENMINICDAKGLSYEMQALALIATKADGSIRDSLSILEQCISGESGLTFENTADILGVIGDEKLAELTQYVLDEDISSALLLLNDAISSGRDVKQIMADWLSYFRNLLIIKFVKSPEVILSMTEENIKRVEEQGRKISNDLLNRGIVELTKAISEAKWSTQPRALLELCVVILSLRENIYEEDISKIKIDKKSVPKRNGNKVVTSFKEEDEELPVFSTADIYNISAESDISREYKGKEDIVTTDENILPEKSSEKEEIDRSIEYNNSTNNSQGNEDLEILWKSIVSKILKKKPALFPMEAKTKLLKIEENQFLVSYEGDSTLMSIKRYKGKELCEDFMEEDMGRSLKMVLIPENSTESLDINETVHRLSEILGTDIKIK